MSSNTFQIEVSTHPGAIWFTLMSHCCQNLKMRKRKTKIIKYNFRYCILHIQELLLW